MNLKTLENSTSTQSNPKPHVAVYCGSKLGSEPTFSAQAYELGARLAQAGLGLVYGGASIGLMGQVADGCLSEQGQVIGVIPEFMLDYEVAHDFLSELHVVADMHERKALMALRSHAFVTLPGGLGTLEEILEMATWRQLGQHDKPMYLLNTLGFYDPLIAHIDSALAHGFISLVDRDRLVLVDTIDELIERLKADLL